jgi:tripartite-type tricarboxylate transporter receptor subunit TctC
MRSLVAVVAAALVLPANSQAQERFPAKPIEMIIPTAPGGGTDASLRYLSELAETHLGQKVVILNKPGGSGAVGVTALTTAKPDGYTVAGVWFAPLTVAPHMLPVSYSPTNYVPVSLSVVVPLVYCVKPDFPAKTGAELIERLRANPNKYTYGTDGVGGASQLATERLSSVGKFKVRGIPFTDSGAILKNFLGGHVDIYMGVIAPILTYVQSGEAKCLLLTTPDRNSALPDAAGLKDVGYPDAATLVWRGVIAPKQTPPDRIKVLEEAYSKAATSQQFQDFMRKQGGLAVGSTSAEFAKTIDQDYGDFGKIVKELGIGKK